MKLEVALEQSVADVTRLERSELKRVMRAGTVASTDNCNWELLLFRNQPSTPERRFSQSRAVALDMESITVAAKGFRFRVPYGTLLCVSDMPLHGEIKLPGIAHHFYRERVNQHLRIGLRAVDLLRRGSVDRLHSRKLRSFAEVAFQQVRRDRRTRLPKKAAAQKATGRSTAPCSNRNNAMRVS